MRKLAGLIRSLRHEDAVYVEVQDFVGVIVQELQGLPDNMVASRDEIIFALQRYANEAVEEAQND